MDSVLRQSCGTSGDVSDKKAEIKDASSRNLKDENSSRVKVKRIPDKARSKFDAPKRAPNSNRRSYNSRSQAQLSGILLTLKESRRDPQWASFFTLQF